MDDREMNDREILVGALTQMIAPKLFVLSGDNPSEMGFPFADDEADLAERLQRQFDPITFWTAKANELADGIVDTLFRDQPIPHADDDLFARSAEYAAKWQPTQTD